MDRNQFLKLLNVPRKRVELKVPETGDTVTILEPPARRRAQFESLLVDDDGEVSREQCLKSREIACACVVVDDQDEYLFSVDDVDLLEGIPTSILDRIYAAAQDKFGLLKKRDLETLEGNSGKTGSDSSPSV